MDRARAAARQRAAGAGADWENRRDLDRRDLDRRDLDRRDLDRRDLDRRDLDRDDRRRPHGDDPQNADWAEWSVRPVARDAQRLFSATQWLFALSVVVVVLISAAVLMGDTAGFQRDTAAAVFGAALLASPLAYGVLIVIMADHPRFWRAAMVSSAVMAVAMTALGVAVVLRHPAETTPAEEATAEMSQAMLAVIAATGFVPLVYWFVRQFRGARALLRAGVPPLGAGFAEIMAASPEIWRRQRAKGHGARARFGGLGTLLVGLGLLGVAVVAGSLVLVTATAGAETPIVDAAAEILKIGVFTVPIWALMVGLGRVLRQPDAAALLAADAREPVLMLRSFKDDAATISSRNSLARFLFFGLYGKIRLERAIARELARIGPFIAIGQPGERLPALGASRAYVDHDAWRTQVLDWMARARRIVIVVGRTEGVIWEIERIAEFDRFQKLLALFPPGSDKERAAEQQAERWAVLERALRGSRWAPLLARINPEGVIALFETPEGRLVALRSDAPRQADYEIAVRLATYAQFADDGLSHEGSIRDGFGENARAPKRRGGSPHRTTS